MTEHTKATALPRLVCTLGLPRAGKSTWARRVSKLHGWPIVSPDAIRLALHGQRYAAEAEPMVWTQAKYMARSLFLAGHDTVILDATNTTRARRDEWIDPRWHTSWVIIEPEDPLKTCLGRADELLRPVIQRMFDLMEPLGDDESEAVVCECECHYKSGLLHPAPCCADRGLSYLHTWGSHTSDCTSHGKVCPHCDVTLHCEEDYIGGSSHYWVLSCPACHRRFYFDTCRFALEPASDEK